MKLLLGKPVAQAIYQTIKKDLKKLRDLGIRPKIAVVLVGEDPSSLLYVGVKYRQATSLGIECVIHRYPEAISEAELCKEIVEMNREPDICGIVVQLPLPSRFSRQQVLDCVLPGFDIDGLTSANQTKLGTSKAAFVPPTPAAILELLKFYKIALIGNHVAIVGAGDLVGKPLAKILVQRGITVSIATSQTSRLKAVTRPADVVITGVGSPKLLKGSMIKKGSVVVDAGTTLQKVGKMVELQGDVDQASVAKVAAGLTPVPGGVGPVTVAMLFRNAIDGCLRLHN